MIHKIIRWFHKQYAEFNGYFWLPCPICHIMTGGHEWKGNNSIKILRRDGMGRFCCSACAKKYGIDSMGYVKGFLYDKKRQVVVKDD